MTDQAEQLRKRLLALQNGKNHAKTFAVASGKGGVGKSNFILNFSLSLAMQNKKVLLFDLDIGMGNIEILLGESAGKNIVDFFEKDVPLEEVIQTGPEGLSYISGGSGLSVLFELGEEKFHYFLSELETVFDRYDYIIFDMGAGISEDSLKFLLSADEIFLITTEEPTSLTDAYAVVKYITQRNSGIPISMIVNRVYSEQDGYGVYQRFSSALNRFLSIEIKLLAILPDDDIVRKSVVRQIPFVIEYPKSKISKAVLQTAFEFLESREGVLKNNSSIPFLAKLKSFFGKGGRMNG
ncbi:MinD/ParA family protein [Metabacillus sp. RGM 3146]|uniref:MinD/ParA family protein n=1 Tax=Metabacillus sp. RGM 3146 TaxID=3401092 RepID=UPI003B99A5A1